MSKEIHLCCYSAHNSLQILCDLSWTEPKWGTDAEKNSGIAEVYIADDGRLYTFESSKITCTKCKAVK